ncbi:MAG: type II toxin-antitoxin system ParD family antitoxin [Flavobacteriaceae bacterium]|nr:type II toxin-antitoxin system ParD family antitoxin [Flavobacteriaceae bacterium]
MAKNTAVFLGDYFNNFIHEQITTGRFTSASEVIRTALRLFEQEENKKKELIEELKKGENFEFIKNFNQKEFLNSMLNKYASDEL